MIFNAFAYFILFLIPSSALFRLVGPKVRPWVCVLSGASFFVYFSITVMAGWVGAACLLIFVWESLISRLYKRGSFWCLVGVLASLAILGEFKYWNFVTGLLSAASRVESVLLGWGLPAARGLVLRLRVHSLCR